MSTDGNDTTTPKSMRQKRILDLAKQDPDASVDEIAAEVPSATPDLVETLLEKYGDPGVQANTMDSAENSSSAGKSVNQNGSTETETSSQETAGEPEDQATKGPADAGAGDNGEPPSVKELPERHRELIGAIAARPEATQQELADQLDVTRATVSRWANEIEEFEWDDRASFVESLSQESLPDSSSAEDGSVTEQLESEDNQSESEQAIDRETEAETSEAIEDVHTDLEELERRLDSLEDTLEERDRTVSIFDSPELVHKIVHACIESDRVSESEELRILRELLK